MSAVDLSALRKAAEAATRGTWDAQVMGSEGYRVLAPNPDSPVRRIVVAIVGHEKWETDRANAEYIAAAGPEVVLELLDRLEQHEGEPCGQVSALMVGRLSGPCTVRGRHTEHRADNGDEWIESVR